MTTTEKLQNLPIEAIEAIVWGTVLDFYSSVSSKNRIMDMMHAHDDFTGAMASGVSFSQDPEEIRECAEAIIDIYNDAL